MRILTMKDVIKSGALDMQLAIEDIAKSFEMHYQQQVIAPLKVHLENVNKKADGYVNIMPAVIDFANDSITGIKLIGRNNTNSRNNKLPNATGVNILYHSNTKLPKAIMDCQIISAIRTGAVSGFAAKYLLTDIKINKVALIGTGVNMKTQVLGLLNC